jgi:hypothetical protein
MLTGRESLRVRDSAQSIGFSIPALGMATRRAYRVDVEQFGTLARRRGT